MWTATKKLADGSAAYYAYAWKGGPLIAKGTGADKDAARADLERLLSQPDAMAKLAAAKEAQVIRPAPSVNYIDGLISAFLKSREFAKIKPRTQREYKGYLEAFRAEFGDWRTSLFEDPRIAQDMADFRDSAAGDRSGDLRMSVVSRLFSWARGRGITNARPTDTIERIHLADRSDVIWDDASLEKLLAVASPDLSRAIHLAVLTGLRLGDLITLPWSAASDIAIQVRTSKCGKRVVIPITDDLRTLLASIPKRSPVILTSSTGNAWTADGLKTAFQRARIKAGISGLRWHDFRGTAVTRLAKTRLTIRDIARIMGWSESRVEAIFERYVSVDALALDMLKRMGQEPIPQTAHKPDA